MNGWEKENNIKGNAAACVEADTDYLSPLPTTDGMSRQDDLNTDSKVLLGPAPSEPILEASTGDPTPSAKSGVGVPWNPTPEGAQEG